MTTQAAKGQQAISNRDYEEAVAQYTAALKTAKSPLWLINRSTAYQRLGKHELALADADNAVVVATQRARRELMATAQFRRAVALHSLKRYGDARLCLTWCRKLNEKEKGLGMWQAKVASDYEIAEKEGQSEMISCTVKETPDPVTEISSDHKEDTKAERPAATPKTAPVAATPSQTPKEKIRHEWYQSNDKVTIMIFAKGVPKDKAEVIIEEGSVSLGLSLLHGAANIPQLEVRFPTGDSGTYDYTVTPLFSRIDPASSEFRITPHKIEINLHKGVPGLKWGDLEGSEAVTPSLSDTNDKPTVPAAVLSPEQSKVPSYPTSSRTGPKNWESLASEALKAEKTDGALGDYDDDDDGDPMGGFFKKLYKDADPDTRRAMMKSYQESNGTALSTNWADVKKGPVETQPPEGLVAKKWGE
jgi:suppressor of G2 allele of SKP1